jgi:50S ribosomal protein L16 3-hydroxylase
MLEFPGNLSPDGFLRQYWQKQPLFMPGALPRVQPSISRNELGWLATLDDVESRLVFTERNRDRCRYVVENGPFDAERLVALPRRDWTLLVHDVEKHLPVMRKLFEHVPFIPDWRIDDLMVSFAAPGGSVGPHRDYYDVFLCQGTGVREWRVSADDVADDPDASDDLSLTAEFDGDAAHTARNGDVLYLPPGVAHWGTAAKACLTYSIGMRAPRRSELVGEQESTVDDPFYADPDLEPGEALPGYISPEAIRRAHSLLVDAAAGGEAPTAVRLGSYVTATKPWLQPELPDAAEIKAILADNRRIHNLKIHGMARLAFDDEYAYVNGNGRSLGPCERDAMAELCALRRTEKALKQAENEDFLAWLITSGAFGMD